MPTIFFATSPASAVVLATLTPPPLPRPPAWICALTTTTSAPLFFFTSSTAALASATLIAGMDTGTGTPYFASSCLPWYSWIFIDSTQFQCVDQLAHGRCRVIEQLLFV